MLLTSIELSQHDGSNEGPNMFSLKKKKKILKLFLFTRSAASGQGQHSLMSVV